MAESSDAQLYELLSRLMDGSISQEQLDVLRTVLAKDPQARQHYIEFMMLSANLRRYVTACEEREPILDDENMSIALAEVIEQDERSQAWEGTSLAEVRREEVKREAETAFERFKEQERRRQEELALRRYLARRRQLAVGAFAAVLLLVVALLGWIAGRPPRPVVQPVVEAPTLPAPPPVVAVVTRASGARWDRAGGLPLVGTDLTPGAMTLEEGFLEVTFKSRARLIIEAPAELSLVDDRRVHLERGALTAHVPEEARGFEVETPSARVTDLGTEFALAVNALGVSDVHVLEGWVAASFENVGDDQRLVKALHQDDAMRFNARAGTMSSITVEGERFVRSWDDVLYKPRLNGSLRFEREIPVSLCTGALEHDEYIRVLLEHTDVRLTTHMAVNIAGPGQYDSFEKVAETLAKDTRVDSYLLHWDPKTPVGTQRIVSGSVTFRRPILGVLVSVDRLSATDARFGRLGVQYPTNDVSRRLESASDRQNADTIVLSPDRLTLEVRLRAISMDQVRILVAAPSAQER